MFVTTVKAHSPVRILPGKGEKTDATAGTYLGPDDDADKEKDGAPTMFRVRRDDDGSVVSYPADQLEILGWN